MSATDDIEEFCKELKELCKKHEVCVLHGDFEDTSTDSYFRVQLKGFRGECHISDDEHFSYTDHDFKF